MPTGIVSPLPVLKVCFHCGSAYYQIALLRDQFRYSDHSRTYPSILTGDRIPGVIGHLIEEGIRRLFKGFAIFRMPVAPYFSSRGSVSQTPGNCHQPVEKTGKLRVMTPALNADTATQRLTVEAGGRPSRAVYQWRAFVVKLFGVIFCWRCHPRKG